jgi:hypothetical protein
MAQGFESLTWSLVGGVEDDRAWRGLKRGGSSRPISLIATLEGVCRFENAINTLGCSTPRPYVE